VRDLHCFWSCAWRGWHVFKFTQMMPSSPRFLEDIMFCGAITRCSQWKLLRTFSCCYNYRSCLKIRQEAADLDNLTLYIATSLSFTESFFVSRNRKPEFKKATTGYCFPCESEFTRAGNFQTKDSDFVRAIFKQRIPISGWFYNATVKKFV